MEKTFADELAELQDRYAQSAGNGGTMTLEEINEDLSAQIDANETSGEE